MRDGDHFYSGRKAGVGFVFEKLASSSIQEFSFRHQSVGASALWHEPLTCLHLLLFGEIKRKKGIIEVGFRIVSSLSLGRI